MRAHPECKALPQVKGKYVNHSRLSDSKQELLEGTLKLKTLVGSLVLLLSCQSVRAQEPKEPKSLDLYLGYSFTGVIPSSRSGLGLFPLQGGDVSVSYKISPWITGVADFGLSGTKARNSNIVGIQIHGTETTYLFGPRLTLPRSKRFTPFAEALFGFARASRGLYDTNRSQISWAWAAGSGLEVRLNGNFSLRPIQIDYLQTHFTEMGNGPQFQKDVRATTGFVLHF
jgi:opacity protein-like surface antigen